jgi:2,4-dienoyl-CoA reductase-like NADH-dependent reductase (Old Yellow Enzyme family)/NADPH-dependent 2,4-dienoyl-CoA reductase/sulfur reductase-like enzyme
MALEHLFSPIRLGKLDIKNRIVMAPMGTNLAHPARAWGEEEIAYFVARAKGGAGLIISPFTAATKVLSDLFRERPLMGIYDDRQVPSHRRMAAAVHAAGSKMIIQAAIFGGKFGEAGPSAIDSPDYSSRPRELNTDEIWEIIEDFGQAARRAREAGYDGIEIHGSHGYLIGQFISPALNKRSDEFGGSREARMKFPVEIYRAMRRQAGEDFTIGFKMSAWEDLEGGVHGGEEATFIAKRMADEGVAYVHVQTLGQGEERVTRYQGAPATYLPRNTIVPLAAEIKSALPSTPIMVSGSIIVPQEAEQFLAEGKCDLIGLGRTLLADPNWPAKAAAGQPFRPCIRCNVCHHQLWLALPLICTVNPYLLREAQEPLQPTARRKKVTVVGGGPGGITAALTAAARGHDVTLCEARHYVGGMLYPGSQPACKAEVGLLLEYYKGELAASSVKVKTDVEVTLQFVQQERPDALVVAVGSHSALPDIPGAHRPHVVAAIEALRDRSLVKGQNVIVIGGGDVGCETACYLADAGRHVTIIEILPELMKEQYINNVKLLMYQLLADKGVKCFTNNIVTQIDEATVEVKGPEGGRTLSADSVIVATGTQPNETLRETLRLGCAEVYIVGDCGKLGRIREAVVQGDLVGRLI